MNTIKVDKSLEINPVALAMLNLLDFSIETEKYDYFMNTRAFYNGREKGICLVCRSTLSSETYLIFFGECRSSDEIFVWESKVSNYFGNPTLEHFDEESYQKRKSFKYNDICKAVNYIEDRVTKYFQ